MAWNSWHLVLVGILTLLYSGCSVNYSATGGSIPDDVKTLYIQSFVNETGQGPATLGQNFTEKLKTYYLNNTKLKQVNGEGDWQLSGKITSFTVTPVALQQNETAGGNRLTITVNVVFVSAKNDKHQFTENFSFFSDFSQSQSLTQVEGQLVEIILDQIVRNIFIKTSSLDW
ncbi:MAG: LPS assembly lipoprotein LptE [Cytophagaceae bacterium]|jgi:hypothetical protein|nr:LPS assembly lipoprotein LptE [Cytophagaceae bacterium]